LEQHAAELLGVSNFGAELSSSSRQVFRLSQNLGGAFVYREIEWFVRVRQQGSLQNLLLCSTFTVSASFEFHACFVVKKKYKGGDVQLAIESAAIDLAAAAAVGGSAVRCGRGFGCSVRCLKKKTKWCKTSYL
jgi:hypothetical protein